MKRVTLKAIVHDDVERNVFDWAIKGVGEIESYQERPVPKEKDLIAEYSFETLWEGAKEFAEGIWMAIKGFIKLSAWAIITIFEGLKYLYRKGVGSKDEKKSEEKKKWKPEAKK